MSNTITDCACGTCASCLASKRWQVRTSFGWAWHGPQCSRCHVHTIEPGLCDECAAGCTRDACASRDGIEVRIYRNEDGVLGIQIDTGDLDDKDQIDPERFVLPRVNVWMNEALIHRAEDGACVDADAEACSAMMADARRAKDAALTAELEAILAEDDNE